MIAAVIGLIGVIVGAVVAGVLNIALDQRQRRARAMVARELIVRELDNAEEKMRSALAAAAPAAPTAARW